MGALGILGWLFSLVGFVCSIIIVIDAFKNEVWKGILCFFCIFYLLYYAFVEYQASNKWLIIGLCILGYALGGGLMATSILGAMSHAATGVGAPLPQ